MTVVGATPRAVHARNEAGDLVSIKADLLRGTVLPAQATTNGAVYVAYDRRFDALLTEPGLESYDLKWELFQGEDVWAEVVPLVNRGGFAQWDVFDQPFEEWVAGVPTGPSETAELYWLRITPLVTMEAFPAILESLSIRPYASLAGPRAVQQQLQFRSAFTSDTRPSFGTVERYLRGAEDEIFRVTRKYYRPELVEDELLDFRPYGMTLRYRPIMAIHQLEIWDGSRWGTHLEGRDREWHYEEETGIVYLSSVFLGNTLPPILRRGYSARRSQGAFKRSVRVNYVHGLDARKDPLVVEVQRVVVKQACIDVITNEDFAHLLPQGLDRLSYQEKVKLWDEDVREFKDRYARLYVA